MEIYLARNIRNGVRRKRERKEGKEGRKTEGKLEVRNTREPA